MHPLLVLIFLFTAALTAILLSLRSEPADPVERRLQELAAGRRRRLERAAAGTAEPPAAGTGRAPPAPRALFRQLLGQVDAQMSGSGFTRRLQERLRRAGLRVLPAEFIAFQAACALAGLALSLAVLNGRAWFLCASGGWMLPGWWLDRQAARRTRQLEAQLPDAMALMANSIRSGYSFLQAMEMVAREMPEPISREFGQALKENRVGISLEEALVSMARRVGSPDLDLAVTAMLIQRQVGGNLAEVLDRIGETVKDRLRLLGQVRTLTTQGRLSGWIIGLLPVCLGLAFYLINPEYVRPLFTHPLGLMLLGIGAAMQVTGIVIIRRMVRLEV